MRNLWNFVIGSWKANYSLFAAGTPVLRVRSHLRTDNFCGEINLRGSPHTNRLPHCSPPRRPESVLRKISFYPDLSEPRQAFSVLGYIRSRWRALTDGLQVRAAAFERLCDCSPWEHRYGSNSPSLQASDGLRNENSITFGYRTQRL